MNIRSYPTMVYTRRPQIEGVIDKREVDKILMEKNAELSKYDEVFLLIFLDSYVDNPLRCNIIRESGLRYFGAVLKNIPHVRNMRARAWKVVEDENIKRKALLEQVKKDKRFDFLMSIQELNVHIFQVKSNQQKEKPCSLRR